MEIAEEVLDRAIVIRPQHRIDSATAQSFEDQLMPHFDGGSRAVIIDCSALDYISSAGLRVILKAAKAANASGCALKLCGMKVNIHEVFAVSGFTNFLTIVKDVEAATALS